MEVLFAAFIILRLTSLSAKIYWPCLTSFPIDFLFVSKFRSMYNISFGWGHTSFKCTTIFMNLRKFTWSLITLCKFTYRKIIQMVIIFLQTPSSFELIKDLHSNPSQDGPFRGCSQMGRTKRSPLSEICQAYPALMKLGTVIPYLNKIQQYIYIT